MPVTRIGDIWIKLLKFSSAQIPPELQRLTLAARSFNMAKEAIVSKRE